MKIRSGPLKGILWNTAISDNRYILGNYEPELSQLIIQETKNGKQFIDIGANAGYFSLLAAKHSKNQVVALEPMPQNVIFLKQHLSSNRIDSVSVEEVAISEKNGEIEFSNSANLSANTYKKESSIFKGFGIKVKTITLNDLAKNHQLKGDCFIKIDVEGAEYDVLEGGKEYLSEFRPNLMVATHDCHVQGVKDKCLSILKELGYKAELIKDQKSIAGQEDFWCTADN